MPRPRFSDWIITPTPVTIAAGDTYTQFIDLVDTFYPQIYYRATWAATGSPTGLGVVVYSGYAIGAIPDYLAPESPTSNVEFTDDGVTISVASQPTINTGTPQTKRNDFALNPEIFPRRVNIEFTNRDATHACTLFISGDR